MTGLTLSSDGLKLSAIPRPSDPYKRDRVAQAAEFLLPASITLKKIEELGEAKVHAKLAGSNPQFELGIRKTTIDLQLLNNSYLYRSGDATDALSLQARLDLRVPEKSNVGADSGVLKLMQGLAAAKAEKRSAATAEIGIANTIADGKRRKLDTTAHRRGLFGAQAAPRSLTGSPNLPPTKDRLDIPTINVTADDPTKKAKQEAIRVALIHLVAVRDVSKDYIARTLKCPPSDIEQSIQRHCTQAMIPNKYKLNPKAYKLLDPYGFNYNEEDRKMVISKAITAFDRMRLGPEEKEWQRLLPKEERGTGKCLSELEKQKVMVLEEKAAALEAKERAGTPPDAQDDTGHAVAAVVSRPGSSGSSTATHKDSAAQLNKRNGDAAKDSSRNKTAERSKAEIKAVTSPSHPTTQAKSTVKRAAEKKVNQSQQSNKAFKSAEFITESDDEEAEAATKVNAVSPRSAPADEPPLKLEATKQSKPVTAGVKKPQTAVTLKQPADKQSPRVSNKPVSSKPTPAATPKAAATSTPSSLARSSAKPAALDRTKLNAKPVTTPVTSSRPPTPSSATMPLMVAKKPLQTKKVMVPISAATSSPRVGAARATSTAAKPKELAKPADKAKATAPRDAGQRPAPKRDPNVPPKKLEPERRTIPAKKPEPLAEARSKQSDAKATALNAKSEKPRSTSQAKPSVSSTAAKPAASESIRAPAMQKTISHQRKSSSPIKPSPLASSPPISASDMDEHRTSAKDSAAGTPLKRPANSIAQHPVAKIARREPPTSQSASITKPSTDSDRATKRKAGEVDSRSTAQGGATSGSLERPAKRRDTGSAATTAAPRSTGASGSSVASRHIPTTSTNTLKARADNERADSHSPSPASSTIGSTSTKGTSSSLIGYVESTGKSGFGKQATRDSDKAGTTIKGFARDELAKAQKFEEEMEKYNKLQREVALMGESAPVEKIRELHTRFSQLERQKKTFAFLANGCQ